MDYSNSVTIRGDASKVFQLAEGALTALGFELRTSSTYMRTFVGPGWSSSRQNPLLGVSEMSFEVRGSQLLLEADLRAANRLGRFAMLFPPLLSLVLMAVLAIAFMLTMPQQSWQLPLFLACGLNAAIWVLLGPFFGRMLRKRTKAALAVLLKNLSKT